MNGEEVPMLPVLVAVGAGVLAFTVIDVIKKATAKARLRDSLNHFSDTDAKTLRDMVRERQFPFRQSDFAASNIEGLLREMENDPQWSALVMDALLQRSEIGRMRYLNAVLPRHKHADASDE
jgi:hypothetical protein